MNERDTIPPAEKLAQFEEPWDMARVAKLLEIGLEKRCGVCGRTYSPDEFSRGEYCQICQPGNIRASRMPVESSEAGARYPDTPETPVAPLRAPCDDYKPIGTGECWTCGRPFYVHGEWIERREAFSNEGEVEP